MSLKPSRKEKLQVAVPHLISKSYAMYYACDTKHTVVQLQMLVSVQFLEEQETWQLTSNSTLIYQHWPERVPQPASVVIIYYIHIVNMFLLLSEITLCLNLCLTSKKKNIKEKPHDKIILYRNCISCVHHQYYWLAGWQKIDICTLVMICK